LLIAAVVDLLLCMALQSRLQSAFSRWQQTVESQGWQVTVGQPSAGGFPSGATLVLPDLTLRGGQALVPGGVDWHAQRVLLAVSLLHPWQLDVAPQGQQVVRIAAGRAMVLNADSLMATVPLGAGRPDHIDIAATGLTGGLRFSGHPEDVRIDSLNLQLAAARGGSARTSMTVALQVSGLGLPDSGRWPLGATITRLKLAAGLASPALSGRSAVEQARAWRDWGGTLDVSALAIKWGPLDLNGSATLGLDDQLQPTGRGHAHVKGWSETLDALASGGVLPPGVAQTAKAVLGLMARGDGAELSIPFALKNSTLSLGNIPVIRLNELAWGDQK
jgi:hypothetical protein